MNESIVAMLMCFLSIFLSAQEKMKTILLIVLISLALSSVAQMKPGLVLGFGQSKITNENAETNPNWTMEKDQSFQFGLSFKYEITKKSSLTLGLLFNNIKSNETHNGGCQVARWVGSSQGGHYKVIPVDCNAEISFNYFSIPILYSWSLSKFRIGAGFSYSWVIDKKYSVKSSGSYAQGFSKDERYFSNVDYGILAEFGFAINEIIFLYGRYYHGMSDIWDGGYYFENKMYVRQLLFGLKIYFDKTKKNE